MQELEEYQPPWLILGDRPLQITLLRTLEGLSWWEKTKLVLLLLRSSMQKPNPDELREWMRGIMESSNNTDLLTESMQNLREHYPSLETSILRERDCYMACKLVQMSDMLPSHLNITCVAIVGAGHCQGMVEWLTDYSTKAGGKSPSELLQDLVKTKKFKDEDVESLTTHMTELYGDDVYQRSISN